MARYYDRAGNPISMMQSVELFNEDERRVGDDTIGPLRVSTVHLVIDHQWGDGPPLIFETMVFGDDDHAPCWRYSTEKEARKAHLSVVDQLKAKLPLGEVDPFDPRYGRGHDA